MIQSKRSIKATVFKDSGGFYAEAHLPFGSGSYEGPTITYASGCTIDATIEDLLKGITFALDDCEQMITRENLSITLDLPSLFEFYKVINVKALSKRLGMNQSLLSQYINGKKKPSRRQTMRIVEGIHQLGRELAEVEIVMR